MATKGRTIALGSGKTDVSLLKASLAGVTVALIIYLAAYSLKDFPSIPVYIYLFERGWFQYISTLAFDVAVGILLLKTDRIKAEKAVFAIVDQQVFAPFVGKTVISGDQTRTIKQAIEQLDPGVRQTMLVGRLENSSRRLANARSAAEVDNIFQILSDGDANTVAASYTTVRFLIALIPLLGFLGNVFGVGQGIGRFSDVLNQAQSFDSVRPALQFAAFKLAIAFDATFLALFYSGILLFLHALVEQREGSLLAAIDEYCIDKFISRIQLASSEGDQLRTTMMQIASEGFDLIEKNAQSIVKAVQEQAAADLAPLREEFRSLTGLMEDVKERLGSVVNLLDNNIHDLGDTLEKLEERASNPVSDLTPIVETLGRVAQQMTALEAVGEGFKAAANMSQMLVDLRRTLEALRPAIDSMSAEMAREVNKVLSQLLRVMVVANRADRWRDEELKILLDPELLRRIFVEVGR